MIDEYGGCLPLESIEINNNPFNNYPCCTYNTGRSAILGAIENYGAKCIWIPFYLCPSVKRFLNNFGILVKEYYLTKEYLPKIEKIANEDMILWTNWYGCMKEDTIDSVIEKFGKQLIFDNAQALFYFPDFEKRECYYVFSCRKFIGVPDGAYLVQRNLDKKKTRELDRQESNWSYLEKARYLGANSQYLSYQKNEESFDDKYADMSCLTKEYLKAISWNSIKKIRKDNFIRMHEKLKEYNELDVDYSSDTPFMYPFLCRSNDRLRKYLLSKNIYVPTWWKYLLQVEAEDMLEFRLTKYLIPIPIDQRYNLDEVEMVADMIIDYLENN